MIPKTGIISGHDIIDHTITPKKLVPGFERTIDWNSMPFATATAVGGVRIGSSVSIVNGVIDVNLGNLTHNQLSNIQGGSVLERYHLNFAQYTSVVNNHNNWLTSLPNHNLVNTTHHPVSGLVTGHFLKATSPNNYAFTAHGLSASDVGAEPIINKSQGYAHYTGSAWIFLNESYSLLSHNHDSIYVPLTRGVTGINSIAGGGSLISDRTFQLVGDTTTPGNNMYYGTNAIGTRGFFTLSAGSMIYPPAGIPLSTGTAWGTSIVNNSANWNTAFGWGNHAGLYSLTTHAHLVSAITIDNFTTGTTPTPLRPFFDILRSNRMAFLPADQIIIEQSTDAGATWVDAGISDSNKRRIFTGQRPSINLPLIAGVRNTNAMVRITITAMKYNQSGATGETDRYNYWNPTFATSAERYNSIDQGWIWITDRADKIWMRIERATGAAPNTWINVREAWLGGNSGGNFFTSNIAIFGAFTPSTTTATWNLRLTFRTGTSSFDFDNAKLSPSSPTVAQVIHDIRFNGENVWVSPNRLMHHDRLYTWDENQNVLFPVEIFAGNSWTNRVYHVGFKPTLADVGFTFPAAGVVQSTGTAWGTSIALADFVRTTQANIFGDFNQTFRSSRLLIRNPANTFNYVFVAGAITADRTVNIPVITATDTLVVTNLAQTLINKTINATNNTISDTSQAIGDILRNDGTRFVRFARGTVANQVIKTNATITDIVWGLVTFAELSDTPATISASQYVRGNTGGTALEFRTAVNVLSDIGAASTAISLTGTNSIIGGGDLSANRTFQLVGDILSPGNNMYYGTNAIGVKSFYALPAGGGTPGGSNTHVQYNNSGAFGGSAKFRWEDAAGILTVNNIIRSPSSTGIGVHGMDLVIKAGNAWGGDATSNFGLLYLSPGTPRASNIIGIVYIGDSTYDNTVIQLSPFNSTPNTSLHIKARGTGSIVIGPNDTSVQIASENLVVSSGLLLFGSSSLPNNIIRGNSGTTTFTKGANISLVGGSAWTTGNNNGGDVFVYGGAPNGTGIRGDVFFGDGTTNLLRARTTETNVVYIDSTTGRLSHGVITGGGGMVYPGAGIALSTGTAWGTSITNNSTNWNTAFSWGNHAGLYRPISYVPSWAEVTSKPTTLSGYGITDAQSFIVAGLNTQYWRGDKTWQVLNTSVVPESGNLYFTDARSRSAISLTTTGNSGAATYTSGTGVLNIPNYTLAGLGFTFPAAGIALSTGTAWGASISNNSANWNTAFSWGNHAGLYSSIAHHHDTLYVSLNRSLTGVNSIIGGGNLTADRTFQLVGDVVSPGNNMYYGTNAVGTRGYYALPGGLPSGTSGQTLRHDGTNWVANSNIFNDGTNVAIGTTLPLSKFHVVGGLINVASDASHPFGAQISGWGGGKGVFGSNLYIDSDGHFRTFGTHSSYGYSAIDIRWGDILFYTFFGATTQHAIVSPISRMIINITGNVGIGITDPTQRLDINGQIRIRGGNPVAGRFLRCDDNGVGTWEALTGGGMVYPSAGIALSTGTTWGTSIVNNSANWNTAFSWGNHAGLYAPLSHHHDSLYAPYPPAGIPVSTGSTWDTSIPLNQFAMVAATQSLTNKTINASLNTIVDSSVSTGALLRFDGTRFKQFTRGAARTVLRGNDAGNDIVWSTLRTFSPVQMIPDNGVFVGNIVTGALGTLAYAAGRMDIAPFSTSVDLPISGVLISVSTAAAGNAKVVIYQADASGRPAGSPVLTSGDIATGTAGTFEIAVSFTFRAEILYYVGVWTSAAPTLRTGAAGSTLPITWTNAATPVAQAVLRITSTFGATAPAWTYAVGQHTSAAAPLVLFRVGTVPVPDNPSNVTLTNNGNGTINVEWTASVGATRYEVRHNVNGGAYGAWVNVGNVLSTILGTWVEGTNICVQVRACNIAGCSIGTQEVCIIVGDPF